jgi:hypothetical protein
LVYELRGQSAFFQREVGMRELILILGAACIASLPFVAFSGWLQTKPRQSNTAMWSEDLRQAGTSYNMPALPKPIPVSASGERK